MKRLLIILTAVTVFMSVEARAQFSYTTGSTPNTPNTNQNSALSAMVAQLGNNYFTPGTPEYASLAAALNPLILKNIIDSITPQAAPVTDRQVIQGMMVNNAVANAPGNKEIQESLTNSLLDTANTEVYLKMAENAGLRHQANVKTLVTETCDPNTNVVIGNPRCAPIDMARLNQGIADYNANWAAEDAANWNNLMLPFQAM